MKKEDQEQMLKTMENRTKYRVLKTFSPPDRLKNWAKKGDIYGASVIYDWGYNIDALIKSGHIEACPKEPFDFQKEIVGKNCHSVYSWCPECLDFKINMPLVNKCEGCGHTATVTFYDAETINNYLSSLKPAS